MGAKTQQNGDPRQIGTNIAAQNKPHRSYDEMVLKSHVIKDRYNILAVIFNWLLLAGYVVFPGTLRAINRTGLLNGSQPGRLVQHALPRSLGGIAIASCVIGGLGIAWLWWILRHNYIWLISRLFFPGIFNSIIALISVLTSVYMSKEMSWFDAMVAWGMTIGYGFIMLSALAIYKVILRFTLRS